MKLFNLKSAVITLTLTAAVLFTYSASSLAAEAIDNRGSISTTGTGVVNAAPDIATINIGVTTLGKDAAKAHAANLTANNAIHNAVKSLGIPAKDIQTNNYYFSPEYRVKGDGRQEISGFVVNNKVTVTIRDVSMVGKVIDTALANGANTIDSISFSLSDTKVYRTEALKTAVQNARSQAEIIASSLGVRIVGVRSANENSHFAQDYKLYAPIEASYDVSTPIEAGTLSMEATVQVDFIIE